MDETQGSSRPKIHRLPKTAAPEGGIYVSRTALLLCLALLVAALIPALSSYNKVEKNKIAASLTPTELNVLSPASGGSEPVMVHDEAGQVVGQITRMPTEADNSKINTTSKVDQKSGKELMSIISKY